MSKWILHLLHMHDDNKVSDKIFRTHMAISVLCIMICMTAMLSTAYAWFVAGISSNQLIISSAYYSIAVVVNQDDISLEAEDGRYIYNCGLATGDEHSFTITATGTAQNGYCKVLIEKMTDGEKTIVDYETYPIEQGKSLDVCIKAAYGCSIEFIPIWCAANETEIATFSLRRPNVFYIDHSTTPHVEYMVVEGVTLEALAEYYGVSVEDICIYNGITELTVGETIKIPGIEDESIEPYQPPMADVATPSNATPSDATPPEEAPSDATPSNATPSEAAPSDATLSDVEPSGETPSEEVPSEAASSDETSSEEAPSEAAPSGEMPSEAVPSDETPSDTMSSDTTSSDVVTPIEESEADTVPASVASPDAEQVDMTEESGAEGSTAETATDAETAETLP